jgi:hypothetical protein
VSVFVDSNIPMYLVIKRPDAIQPVFDVLLGVVD